MKNNTSNVAVAVLMACHNRREKTLKCIEKLLEANLKAGVRLSLFVCDDGSTDGTSRAVLEAFPSAEIIRADGSLFWNRAMRMSFSRAMLVGFDYYFWLNDDTYLFEDSLCSFLEAVRFSGEGKAIVVGAICDPDNGGITYGGLRRPSPRLRPFLSRLVEPSGVPQEVDVMNGNAVFIPAEAATLVGNLDYVFEHGMGDTDYSMRARSVGVRLLTTSKYVGSCSRNTQSGTHEDKSMGLRKRFEFIFSKKGLPLKTWLTMCVRHGGVLWPIHFIWGYTKLFFR